MGCGKPSRTKVLSLVIKSNPTDLNIKGEGNKEGEANKNDNFDHFSAKEEHTDRSKLAKKNDIIKVEDLNFD